MDELDSDLLLCCGVFITLAMMKNKMKKAHPRRFWVRPSLRSRKNEVLYKALEDDDVGLAGELRSSIQNFLRMDNTQVENLLKLIEPIIAKKHTNCREPITPKDRLCVTLRFLATGDSYRSLQYLFKISNQAISEFVPEVLDALIEVLRDQIQTPKTAREWKNIAQQFEVSWNYPHAIGSLDGKHCQIQSPKFSGTEFHNYKGFFSIVLLGLADADYNFIYINVGAQGRISDGGIFAGSGLKTAILNDTLNLPPAEILPGRPIDTTKIPYVFLGDNAFPLMANLMKPFSGIYEAGSPRRIFNYRLSRARRVIENTFGIMSSVFRVLRKPMMLEPEKAKKVVKTCALLHNYLRKNCRREYNPPGSFDVEDIDGVTIIPGQWRNDLPTASFQSLPPVMGRTSITAQAVREDFCEYFNSPIGRVPWQDNF